MVHWLDICAPDPVMVLFIYLLQFFLEALESILISLLICLIETDRRLCRVVSDTLPLATGVALTKSAI